MPEDYAEKDLKAALLANLKALILEPSRGKDNVVVEYAMSRSLIPALMAEYQLVLPSRGLRRSLLTSGS